MSGPWDRPSSDDPDASWPSEDLRASSDRGVARDPGSEGAPGWDDWPPAPPPSDDFLIEEPLPPSSDPWAESWTAEEADAMLRSAAADAAADADAASWGPDRPEALQAEPHEVGWRPEPHEQPGTDAPERDRPPEESVTVRPGLESDTDDPPAIGPWSPDPDPWPFEPALAPGSESLPDPSRGTATSDEPAPQAEGEAEAEPSTEFEAARPAARWPTPREALPDWLAEPLPADLEPDAPTTDGDVAAEPVSAADIEPEPAPDADVAAPPEATEHSDAAPAPDEEDDSEPFWKSILPWRSTGRDEPEPDVEPEPEAERETSPEPGSRPEPQVAADADEVAVAAAGASIDETAAVAAPEPESRTDVDVDADADDEHPWLQIDEPRADDLEPEPEPEAESRPESDIEGSSVAVDAPFEPRWPASVPEPLTDDTPADAPAGDEPDHGQPEHDEPPREDASPAFVPLGSDFRYTAAADRESADEAPDEPAPPPVADDVPDPWVEPVWADRGESTQVLPTDWTPRQPEPPATGTLEPSAGPIRTSLAGRDADEIDDEAVAPTVAEQAVPWLIGVILLLAGMVIVLLALIFAGDGSLGGGAPADPTPSPTLAVVVPPPSPSGTPAATTDPEPSPATTSTPAPEPTPTPEPLPEYGPLEMVYQGRSAALAPIYLLRRDFSVQAEPEPLAQDQQFDVRRFAWAPDGTVGAGLLVDVLVSIEPGAEKRRLGEGLSTITFGDDASTVYAVRITEAGADDTATVLAIDFRSGDTDELASVTYSRPQLGDEPALSEARFSDEGGAVRLFWLHDDRLRLWVLGAGSWTIDPADGEVREHARERLPVLVSPNGRDRVTVDSTDGVSTLTLVDMNDRRIASTTIDGIVSHLRWSPGGDMVAFTVGRSAAAGGVIQNLFVWYLEDGEAPIQLTDTGAAFGVEWLGSQPRWRD